MGGGGGCGAAGGWGGGGGCSYYVLTYMPSSEVSVTHLSGVGDERRITLLPSSPTAVIDTLST